MNKKAVILSGGLGKRLQPFTNVIPKPLLPLGEKAILEVQIERLVKFGFQEIILATNYKSDYFYKFFGNGSQYGIKLTISQEEKPLGTAGPIKLLQKNFEDPFLVMNGDILTQVNLEELYKFAYEKNSLMTVGIKKITLPYDFGNIFFTGDYVTGIEEKKEITTYALAGIYVMKPEVLSLIPDNKYFGMDMLIQTMLEKNQPIVKFEITDYWIDIGNIENYQKAQFDYRNNFQIQK
ncbi:sugar phosphate nucleotidyltransferase [Flexilinea flocculi]|jgi:NDP-sugar pyrophosphorylase family protein|uniref:Nucleotidyl transferase n=1 Tax=Flexilinea flocculi TaxID=1678840 RepID=A0A0S7BS84_9CHLR|nr:sugar phosphate nucleotidyltransferase [Flexilinea flocculi]GAP41303.1 nucleotidyl transferase [Flexilinea flocculi]